MDELTQDRAPVGRTDRSRKRSQRAFNAVARAVLSSPAHRLMSGGLMVVEVVGRKTGTLYAIPVAFADHDGQVLAASGGTWVRNLARERPAVLVHHGRRSVVLPEIASDRDRALEIAAVLLPPNPILRRNVGVQLGDDGKPVPGQVDAALERGVRFLAFHPPR
jgi:hypothetical protein